MYSNQIDGPAANTLSLLVYSPLYQLSLTYRYLTTDIYVTLLSCLEIIAPLDLTPYTSLFE
jgi:hypothetical protein